MSSQRASQIILTVMRLGLAAALFSSLTRTLADADLWGHLLFGRDILALHALPTQDTYSFTSDIPWVNHEWLAEVIASWSYQHGGTALLVATKSLLLLSMMGFVLVSLRRVSGDPVVHDLMMFLAVAGTYGRSITFRPQVFSLMLFPAMLLAVLAAERGRPRALVAIPFIFLFWTNLHGGWIVGFGALAVWLAWNLLRPQDHGLKRWWLATVALASLAATLGNPYGLKLWLFLHETVGVSRQIVDWQPMWTLPLVLYTPWITTTLLVVAAAAFEWQRINPAHLAIVAMCWIGSVRVNRIDAFFVLSALILLAPHIRVAFRRVVPSTELLALARPAPVRAVILMALIIGLAGGVAGREHFSCIPLDEQSVPEREAVAFFKANQLQGRLLTLFDWGEYAIWHLAPEIKVSMDGRRETVYSEELFAAHMKLYGNETGATELVDRLQPNFVWLPKHYGALRVLEDSGWHRMFTGSKSAMLARSPGTWSPPAVEAGTGVRCFPGP